MSLQGYVGAVIRANNRTYGLAPSREMGPEEIITGILDTYSFAVVTDAGNVYRNGDFTVMRLAGK